MPGRIVRVAVKPGDRVARHAPLAVLEAMKMQNEIPAPVAGRVREVRVKVGQGVLVSDVLVVLEPE
jgi:pyruvate carboxylase subunit B